jgi:DNA recombination-dependent growth factor C
VSIIKGTVSLTRYRVLDQPVEIGDEFIAERLQRNAFIDIEGGVEEESAGWVEILDQLSTSFGPVDFRFGDVSVMSMRVDNRKVSAKMVNRYLAMALAEAEERSEKPLGAEDRRLLKSKVRQDLLARTPVNTDIYEVVWLPKRDEVWLAAVGTKVRERFEDLWRRTFNLGLMLKIPYVLARELLPGEVSPEDLDQTRPSALMGQGD